MSGIIRLETTFNTVAEKYDRTRPTYVDELYRDVFMYGNIGRGSRTLEIGIGTGQATRPVLEAGCSVEAVELGNELAAFCERKFSSYDLFSVRNIDFVEYEESADSFDMVYSASAFHWIPEELGYKKVYGLLKPGGIFARFANHPSKDRRKPKLHEAMQKWYAVYMPDTPFDGGGYSKEQARKRAFIAEKYGFIDIEYRLYERTRTFTAEQYVDLLGTYSDHIALGEEKQEEFFRHIKEEINRFGGTITIYDTIDLQLHRKAW